MRINLAEFVLLITFATCLAVCVLTVVSRTLHALSEAKSLRKRVICRLCLNAYEEPAKKSTSTCPMCSAQNIRGRSRTLS